tara:strand:+ start:254 stop:535 length:282 start_codon:yes stop_codon:yes gene_type:complete
MTEGLLAVAAVVFLSMTVLVPVVLDDTVFELLDTVLDEVLTVLDEVLTVLPIVVFVVTVSVEWAGNTPKITPANSARATALLTITAPSQTRLQ